MFLCVTIKLSAFSGLQVCSEDLVRLKQELADCKEELKEGRSSGSCTEVGGFVLPGGCQSAFCASFCNYSCHACYSL